MKWTKALKNGGLITGIWLLILGIAWILIFTGVFRGLLLRVVTTAMVYAIAAVGLNLVVGYTGQLAIGHGGFFMIGGYTSALLFMIFDLPWPLAFAAGGLLAAVAGLLIGMPTLKLRGDYLAIVTLGFGQIIQSSLNNMTLFVEQVTRMVGDSTVVTKSIVSALADGSAPPPSLEVGGEITAVAVSRIVNGATGITGIPGFASGNMNIPAVFFWTGLTLMVVSILLRNFIRSSHGRALISIREDDIASGTMGIPVYRYKLLSFVISAFITGIAGGLYVVLVRTAVPDSFNFLMSVNFVIIIVLGGLGSNTGAIMGSFVFMLTQEWLLRDIIPLENFKGLIFALILILLMIFFPGGMMGRKELTLNMMKKWFGVKPPANPTQVGGQR